MGPIFTFLGTFIVVFVLSFVVLTDLDNHDKLHKAEHKAQRLCAEQNGAETYDVEGENKMVYACRKDGKLRVLAY